MVVVVVVTTVVSVVGAKENCPSISSGPKSCVACLLSSETSGYLRRCDVDMAGGEKTVGVRAAMLLLPRYCSLACLCGRNGGGVFRFRRGGSMEV